MQSKVTLLIVLQTCCLAFFVLTALACQTTNPMVKAKTEYVKHSECQTGDYLYIGSHSSQADANAVARSKGLTEACSNEHNQGTYFAK